MKPKSVKVLVEEKLINEVRDRPYLYSKKDVDYKDTLKKENAWTAIAKVIGLSSGEDADKLWVALRNQYRAFERRLNKPTGSAGGTRPYYRHEAAMRFYSDSSAVNETYDNLDGSKTGQEEVELNDDIEDLVDSPTSPPSNEAAGHLDTRSHTKFSGKRKLDTFEEKLINIFEDQSKAQEDEYYNFCISMAPKLRRIHDKDPAKAAEVQLQIQSILFNAEFS